MATITMLILYFVVILAISIVAYKLTRNHRDYILGGRNLSAFVTALGVGASDMSGWLMLGLPGALYLSGFSQTWMPIGLIIGAFTFTHIHRDCRRFLNFTGLFFASF